MCGINGVFNLNGKPVAPEELRFMNSMMVHRGPDDEGYFLDKNIGLSMRRLSIIDIEGGRHPVVEHTLDDGQFVDNDLLLDTDENQLFIITGYI